MHALSRFLDAERDSHPHRGSIGEGAREGWRSTFRTGKPGSEAVPIVVDGVMYVTAPDGIYALVPETGDLLWKTDEAQRPLLVVPQHQDD